MPTCHVLDHKEALPSSTSRRSNISRSRDLMRMLGPHRSGPMTSNASRASEQLEEDDDGSTQLCR
jgi:hypothetical protein